MDTGDTRRDIIAQAHRRCADMGLHHDGPPARAALPEAGLARLMERNGAWCRLAAPLMEALYAQIAESRHMVVLTDADGVVLHALGDPAWLGSAAPEAMRPGTAWSEASMGANAIGTALASKAPVQVHGEEHFLRAHRSLSSAAAPIFDAEGQVIGALDVAGAQCAGGHPHTMALVRMTAQEIENRLFAQACGNAAMVQFHACAELVGTAAGGCAAFSPGGRVLYVNRGGVSQCGMPLPRLRAHTLVSLLGLDPAALAPGAADGPLALVLPDGRRLHGRVVRRSGAWPGGEGGQAGGGTGGAGRSAPAGARPAGGLRALDTGDRQLAQAIAAVGKVLGRGIPIMILGETGTGKEWLAQAIHHDGQRAAGPLVVVNCAAIPESLIESELFGYEDGAFTGARKKGAVGRIAQAHGGTLFLDEIGDMPPGLQARLLRVLQERSVTPLGGGRAVPVDIDLVCATHRSLRGLIAEGGFREDLYYRLNGLVVKLPPLRERGDLRAVVARVLAGLPGGGRCAVSDEVMRLFESHRWPGNLRQLHSVLRTAVALSGADEACEPEISLCHLPSDFLEEDAPRGPAPGPHCAGSLETEALEVIRRALERCGGNVSAAAKALGISRNTIYRKMAGAPALP
ncbi:sigma-54-dependent Fis family transcriptional regulator [Pseudoduganella namucuonensis]|uniref:Transcriptional regulator of acetoin/glycerol metabolism n=1 Tax=Pseudoduganella namucuonensis TaxID=1035707 RepID=A0A1I7L724_9BURK|nr:sigma-54-dependent Fis family transcriptional regulator [Pseudoduganella namucuonensis]SFV05602.1 Transcriptional regulator of acetoin/glycerol metabolism [Pseudoduganella namucuonensis]